MRRVVFIAAAVFAVIVSLFPVPAQAVIPPITAVTADAETVPVTHSGDAADDPAIWVHPSNPANSLLIGNDKQGALEVYNVDGTLRQRLTTATSFWGNVDVRQQVAVDGRTLDVVAAYNGGLRLYTVQLANRTLQSVTDGTGVYPTSGGEGLCLYHSRLSGDVTVFVITRPGQVRQFLLTDNDADGLLQASMVREFAVGSEAEGCVADDEAGLVYIAEEDVGLWRYGAEPTAGTARVSVDSVQSAGNLTADVEGLTLVDTGGDGGYLIASAQNVNNPTQSYFVRYDRQTNEFAGAFRIVNGTAADGCTRTDGVTVTATSLGAAYPNGVFVCQDDNNTTPGGSGNQDFKLTRLEKVADLTPSENASPTASFTVSCSSLTCTFDATGSSDADGRVASYRWDFGDGTTDTRATTTHTYSGPGARTVTLTVRDDQDAIGFTARAASPVAPAAALAYVAANSTNGNRTVHAVQVPAGVQAGDALLLFFTGNLETVTISGPAGWTGVHAVSPSGVAGRLWSKVATGSDGGSTVTVTSSAITKSDLTVAAYRGTAASPIGASAVKVDTATATSHTTPTVSVTDPGGWLVSYWADKSSSTTAWTTPAGQSVRSGSTGTGGGHITSVLTDGNGPVSPGTRGGLTATTNAPGSRAVMFTVLLDRDTDAATTAERLPPSQRPRNKARPHSG